MKLFFSQYQDIGIYKLLQSQGYESLENNFVKESTGVSRYGNKKLQDEYQSSYASAKKRSSRKIITFFDTLIMCFLFCLPVVFKLLWPFKKMYYFSKYQFEKPIFSRFKLSRRGGR